MKTHATLLVLLLACGFAIHSPAIAQEQDGPPDPTASPEAAFRVYCAGCHGEDGRGKGVLEYALTTPAPDLTRIAARNGGVFPRAKVARIIDGRDQIAAHGEREMPVWGDWFRLEAEAQVGGEEDKAAIQKRIDDLVDLLESMQE